MKSIEPPTREAEARLETFLSRPSHPEGTYSLGEVRGFLFAVAAAPDLVKPSEWLPFIFGGEEPEFGDLEEAQQVMDALMPLYNESNDLVRTKGPRLPRGCEFHDDLLANLEPDAPLSQWSRGFAAGHVWLEEIWDEYLPAEWYDEMGAILATLTFFASPSIAQRIVEESPKADASLEHLAAKFRDLFPDAIAGYAGMGLSIWENLLKTREEERGPIVPETRIGRNEPCPCGSGRKYKRCCGASVH